MRSAILTFSVFHGLGALVVSASTASAKEEWEVIFSENITSEYSQTRQDALKQIDTTSSKGLKTIWGFLDKMAPKDPLRYDWYVREGAFEALMSAEGEECDAEFLRLLRGKSYENSKEAVVHSVIWKIRKAFEKSHGENDDDKIREAKYFLRKKRGVEFFALVLPTVKELDPEKKMLGWIHAAFADRSSKVRLAAITGMLAYPDKSSVEMLLDNLKKIEKSKKKMYKEWIFTRYGLEVLTGQNYRDDVQNWFRWWEIAKGDFSIEDRVDKEVDEDGKSKKSRGKTEVVNTGGVEVTVNMKIAGIEGGYPLLVLPRVGYEPDYFRPYFHGVENFARVYYVQMPQLDDFKGLSRDKNTNLVMYPTEVLANAIAKIMEDSELEKYAVLGHGPASATQAMSIAAKFPKSVSHLVLINPASSGDRYRDRLDSVKREGRRRKSPELVNAVDNLLIDQSGKPTYEPADAAESGGLGRALGNVSFADPSSAEIGALEFFYRLMGGQKTMNDRTWSVSKLFKNKAPRRLPVMIVQGERDPWTPVGDMGRVASFFKGAYVSKFKTRCKHMFIFEPYRFTRELESWFKKKGVKMPSKKKSRSR